MKRETLIQNAVCNNLIAAADLVESECEHKLQESKHCLNCVYFIQRKNGSTACLYKIMQETFGFMISHDLRDEPTECVAMLLTNLYKRYQIDHQTMIYEANK